MQQHCLSWCFSSSHKSKHGSKQSDRVTVTLSTAEAQPGLSPLAVGGPEVVSAKVAGTINTNVAFPTYRQQF